VRKSDESLYVKLHDETEYRLDSAKGQIDRSFQVPSRFRHILGRVKPAPTLRGTFEFHSELAKLTFEEYGNHIFMLFLFDPQWRVVDMVTTTFADQSDKYIFWRHAALRTIDSGASGAVWIGESWQREFNRHDVAPVRNMRIIGENLHVFAFDHTGEVLKVAWSIVRETGKPVLVPDTEWTNIEDAQVNIIEPVRRAFGVVSAH
jgi:hypothetical protein